MEQDSNSTGDYKPDEGMTMMYGCPGVQPTQPYNPDWIITTGTNIFQESEIEKENKKLKKENQKLNRKILKLLDRVLKLLEEK